MSKSQFLDRLESVLEVERERTKLEDSLFDLSRWNSMAALTFISLADQDLNVTITGAQIEVCDTVADLL